MPQVKVWNDNKHPHKETFKGDTIVIPPGEFVMMDYEDAVQFRGQFTPMAPEDHPEPWQFFKKIRVEQPAEPIFKDDGLTCHANGKKASSKEELAALLADFAHLRVKDDEAEKVEKASQKSELEELKAQLAQVQAMLAAQAAEKKGPGRPKKEA